MPVLHVQHLTKQYGSLAALNDLDLIVEAGQVFGLLGPNGSGKTTLLASILDVIRPSSGTYTWFDGKAGSHVRRRIGALLETPNFYPYLNADQNLSIVAGIKNVPQTSFDSLLELVQLKDRRRSTFKTYSLGMKQRLALAACLIGDPDVLILDEPTNGLDPEGMIQIRKIILEIASRGKTILLASHILDEVEKICSHVAIIKNGKRLASGAVGSILSDLPTVEISAAQADMEKLLNLVTATTWIKKLQRNGTKLTMELNAGHLPRELNQLAFENGITLDHLVSKTRSLEVEFLEITKS
ncbi:MAG: ABC transporter ATP-binding protein [Blastochloris sp.]|nr:ABC transporter ATP-binding protein [Blastochloris sp.]